MSDGRLSQLHDREIQQRRRSTLYLLVLATGCIVVITGVAIAILAIAGAVH